MSETTLPRPADDLLDPEPAPDHGDRRRKAVALGALAVVTLAGAGVLLLTGGGTDELDEAPITPVRPVTGTVAAPDARAQPPEVVEDARPARDPFQAVVVASAPAAPTTPGAAGAPGSSTGSTGAAPGSTGATPQGPPPSDGAAVPVTAPAAPAAPLAPADAAGSAPGTAPRRLALGRVEGSGDQRKAVFVVDDESITVSVGDSFGASGDLLLVSLQQGPADAQWTAVVQIGKGEPFDVVTGSPVTLP